MRPTSAILLLALATLALLPSCGKARKAYPDPAPGWHAADYSVVFGRVQRIPSADPDAPPLWIIRYDYSNSDKYNGRLNLFPPEKLAGYSGGELVQIRGRVRSDLWHKEFPGAWYEITDISAWSGIGYR